MRRRSLEGRLPRALLASTVAALAIAPSALAGSWSWTGWFTSTNPNTGPCYWYYSDKGMACSGHNYWNVSAFNNPYCQFGHIHVGFQNGQRIRGRVFTTDICYNTVTFLTYPVDVGMSGLYMLAHTMYWSDASTYGTAWATA